MMPSTIYSSYWKRHTICWLVIIVVWLWGMGSNSTMTLRYDPEGLQKQIIDNDESKGGNQTRTNNSSCNEKGTIKSYDGPLVGVIADDADLVKKDLYYLKRYRTSTSSSTPNATTAGKYCYRYCTDYQLKTNKILYAQVYPIVFQAGLNDRIMILDALSNLASYLCASVEIPKPTFHLHPMHNNNTNVDPSLTWADFVEFTRVVQPNGVDQGNTGRERQQEGGLHKQQRENQVSVVADMVNLKNHRKVPDPNSMYREEPYNNWMRVTTESMEQIVSHFEQIEILSFRQTLQNRLQQGQRENDLQSINQAITATAASTTIRPFIWDIRENYWFFLPNLVNHIVNQASKRQQQRGSQVDHQYDRGTFNQSILSTLSSSSSPLELPELLPMIDSRQQMNNGECRYVIQTRPRILQTIVDRIWNEDILSSSSSSSSPSSANAKEAGPYVVIYLHIRRTDTLSVCNTTLEQMEAYLQCSLLPLTRNRIISTEAATNPHSMDNHGTSNVSKIILLFGSDETNQRYRYGIQRIVEGIEDSIRFLSVDDVVRQRVREYIMEQQSDPEHQEKAQSNRKNIVGGSRRSYPSSAIPLSHAHWNNYYLFETQNAIMHRADFRLEQHRSDACHDCDPIYFH